MPTVQAFSGIDVGHVIRKVNKKQQCHALALSESPMSRETPLKARNSTEEVGLKQRNKNLCFAQMH